MELRKLKRTELKVGVPIAWPLYDEGHQMVVLPGFVPRDESTRNLLADMGLFRSPEGPVCPDSAREAARAKTPVEASQKIVKEKDPSFAEIAFPVGSPFTLVGNADPTHRKLHVKLIGWIEGDTLLLTHPATDDHLLFIKDGEAVHVRAGHDKYVCTFDTSVIKAQLQPFPYLHLKYPSRINVSRVRGTSRVKTGIIASAGLQGDTVRHACTVRDLSLKGLLVHCKDPIAKPGEPIDIYFRVSLDGERHDLELSGMVRNVSPAIDHGKAHGWNHGVELDTIPHLQRRLLQVYIYSRQVEDF